MFRDWFLCNYSLEKIYATNVFFKIKVVYIDWYGLPVCFLINLYMGENDSYQSTQYGRYVINLIIQPEEIIL